MVADLSSYSLAGRLCLVTGGGTGIGLGITRSLVDAGARVIISGRRLGPLDEARNELGEAVIAKAHDISDLPGIPGFLDSVERDHGPINAVINNAGVHQKKSSLDVSDEDLAAVLLTNARAVFALTREAAVRMADRGGGSIQIISSMAAIFGIPYIASYTMSKSAVTGLVRELAVEWGPLGIRVNAIAPGFIRTEMAGKALDNDRARKEKVLGRTPMGRLGLPDEIGRVSAFLVSDAASFITGVTLPVDGGASIGF